MKHRILALALAITCSSSGRAASLHVDDFQSDTTTAGWSGGASPTYVATGGPAGEGDAFLRISATPGGRLATFNTAAAWGGDYRAVGATAVKVSLMAPPTSAPLPVRLVLFGPGSNFDRWTSTVEQTVPNDGLWGSYAFGVGAGELTRVLGGGTHDELTGSVLRVMLRYDPGAPTATGAGVVSPGGVLNIDNIELSGGEVSPLAGDFDGDGRVDAADLVDPQAGWMARFGGDLLGSDFLLWQQNLGQTLPAAAAALTTPEPPAGAILLIAALGSLPLGRIAQNRRSPRPRAALTVVG